MISLKNCICIWIKKTKNTNRSIKKFYVQCIRAKCTNAKDNLHQPLPENTTNNTKNNSADISILPSKKRIIYFQKI